MRQGYPCAGMCDMRQRSGRSGAPKRSSRQPVKQMAAGPLHGVASGCLPAGHADMQARHEAQLHPIACQPGPPWGPHPGEDDSGSERPQLAGGGRGSVEECADCGRVALPGHQPPASQKRDAEEGRQGPRSRQRKASLQRGTDSHRASTQARRQAGCLEEQGGTSAVGGRSARGRAVAGTKGALHGARCRQHSTACSARCGVGASLVEEGGQEVEGLQGWEGRGGGGRRRDGQLERGWEGQSSHGTLGQHRDWPRDELAAPAPGHVARALQKRSREQPLARPGPPYLEGPHRSVQQRVVERGAQQEEQGEHEEAQRLAAHAAPAGQVHSKGGHIV